MHVDSRNRNVGHTFMGWLLRQQKDDSSSVEYGIHFAF